MSYREKTERCVWTKSENEWRKNGTTRRVKEIRTCTGDELVK